MTTALQLASIVFDYAYDAADRLASLIGSGTGVPPMAFALDYNPTNGLTRSIANVDTGIGAA